MPAEMPAIPSSGLPQPGDPEYAGYAAANKGPAILIFISIFTAVAALFVIGRLYSRLLSIGRLHVDDWICVLCSLVSISYVAVDAAAIYHGGGRHASTLDPADLQRATYFTVISFVLGILSFVIPKYSVLILLVKILDPGPIHRKIMWVVSVGYLALSIGMIVVNFVQCGPVQLGGAEGTCMNSNHTLVYALTHGVASVLFDFYLAIYPTVVLARMHMDWRKKAGLSAALGFGYCAGIVATYKCTTLWGLSSVTDFTYGVDSLLVWTNIEASFVLIGACIPTLYPLVKRIFGNSALGGSTPADAKSPEDGTSGPQSPGGVLTIGRVPVQRKPIDETLSHIYMFEDGDGDSQCIILEERQLHSRTSSSQHPRPLTTETDRTQGEFRPRSSEDGR